MFALSRKVGKRLTFSEPFKSQIFYTALRLLGTTRLLTLIPNPEKSACGLVFLNIMPFTSYQAAWQPPDANGTLSWEASRQLRLLMALCWHSTAVPSQKRQDLKLCAPIDWPLITPAARPLWNKERQCVSFFVAHYLKAESLSEHPIISST